MTPLAEYIVEQASQAQAQGLTELQFRNKWTARVAARAEARGRSLQAATEEAKAAGRWPW